MWLKPSNNFSSILVYTQNKTLSMPHEALCGLVPGHASRLITNNLLPSSLCSSHTGLFVFWRSHQPCVPPLGLCTCCFFCLCHVFCPDPPVDFLLPHSGHYPTFSREGTLNFPHKISPPAGLYPFVFLHSTLQDSKLYHRIIHLLVYYPSNVSRDFAILKYWVSWALKRAWYIIRSSIHIDWVHEWAKLLGRRATWAH